MNRAERRRKGWKSTDPVTLFHKMIGGLENGMLQHGTANIIHIQHDDWCPCADGDRGLLACTCQEVFYKVERIRE